jgi:hydrogenase-4 component B
VAVLAAAVVALGVAAPWAAWLFPMAPGVPAPDAQEGLRAGMPAGASLLAPALGALLAAAVAAAALLRRVAGGRSKERRYHTWDCGQPIDETMEYTATGFSAPIRFFLRDIVRAEKHLSFEPVVGTNRWIRRGVMDFRKAPDRIGRLYFVVAAVIEGVGARLKLLQNGVIQFYIALVLATLLFTLWVAL